METYNDELKIYRGDDFVISDGISEDIVIHQPTLNEICTYGEHEYYSMIYQLTATPQTMKWQLWDVMSIDYTKITPYQLFCGILHNIYSQKQTSILFGDLNLPNYEIGEDEKGEKILYQKINNEYSFINEDRYNKIADYIRKAHGIVKDEKMPANESTKMILIEDARDEFIISQGKEWHSNLMNMVSAMVNSPGFKYGHYDVWDMKINAFIDSVKRISKIKNADILLQSGYSGFGINLKDIGNKQLDWLGELE